MKETEAIAMRETTLSVNIEESQQSGMKKKKCPGKLQKITRVYFLRKQ